MSQIRGRGNKSTELLLAQIFRSLHIFGWRRHQTLVIKISGLKSKSHSSKSPLQNSPLIKTFRVRPDFTFPKRKFTIFVDGCFWHGCPIHGSLPKNNNSFWRKKLATNKKRDILVTRVLKINGWSVLRIWEHDLIIAKRPWLLKKITTYLS
jgi:DNA mismatch endonuclease (patch repair protein)